MQKTLWTSIFPALGMFMLIIDAKTAIMGAQDAIALCSFTVIPSLFPFFFLSILLTGNLAGKQIKFLRPVGRLLQIPQGSESLFFIGLLGGYPTGAQAVADGYRNETLSEPQAKRMLGFVSNAGPAFLFGITGILFSNPSIAWWLWGIHILSAVLSAFVLPKAPSTKTKGLSAGHISSSFALKKALIITAQVCGWVMLFRVILTFLQRWILWYFPPIFSLILSGILELTNGFSELSSVMCQGQQFILASAFLAFGGICILMQTVSVTAGLGLGYYLPGKIVQCSVSISLAWVMQHFLFPPEMQWQIPAFIPIITTCVPMVLAFSLRIPKKKIAFRKTLMYNK